MILDPVLAADPCPWPAALCGAGAAVLAYFIGVYRGYHDVRSEAEDLSRELADERAFATRLLDDPTFYQQARAVIEATCDPATFGDFGRVSHGPGRIR